jgi:hypothetical protein
MLRHVEENGAAEKTTGDRSEAAATTNARLTLIDLRIVKASDVDRRERIARRQEVRNNITIILVVK